MPAVVGDQIVEHRKKTIFVTVGTTLFEPLVDAVMSEAALQWMAHAGYTHLIVQYGKGAKPALVPHDHPPLSLMVELYAFKPSLESDMRAADLILCHAGAGTLMEALQLGTDANGCVAKKIVTVINTALMDNHQAEVAHALAAHKLLFVVEQASDLVLPSTSSSTESLSSSGRCCWDAMEKFQPAPYTGGDPHDVPRLLDGFFGFDNHNHNKKAE